MVTSQTMKKSLESINLRLQLIMKSKYMLSYKQTLKIIREGKDKLIILANCPSLRKSETILYYVALKLVYIITVATTLNWV
uniref:60S ribosomal protein L30 n=1 Tax=Sarcophilus harrisii TaxID=9305 RepID=A0A7N4PU71_SARHA